MKLISCYVRNFGALSGFALNFQPGLTAIFSPNGSGKSTLAAFIAAMFYGLPADTARSKFNARRRYAPYSGGEFGGNITFSHKGFVYRIERFFDGSSGDERRVYRDGAPCSDFDGKEPGEVVFGLDASSFARTLFIEGGGGELSATEGISARLSDLSSPCGGEYDLPAALESLEKAAKNLQSRGGKGRIPALEERVKTLAAKTARIEEVKQALAENYAKSSAISARLSSLKGERTRLSAEAIAAERWARYDDMRASADKKFARMREIEDKYPAGLPSEEDAAELSRASLGIDGADARIIGRFSVGAPTAEDLRAFNTNAAAYSRANNPSAPKTRPPVKPALLSAALCAAIMVAGGVLVGLGYALPGALALAAGGLFLAATLCILFVGRSDGAVSRRAQRRIAAFLSRYGMSTGDTAADIQNFNNEYSRYAALTAGNFAVGTAGISGLFAKYGLSGDPAAAAAGMLRDIAEYRTLKEQAEAEDVNAKAYLATLGERPSPQKKQPSREDGEEELAKRLAAVNRDISDGESLVERLGEEAAALDGAREELDLCRKQYTAYTAAAEYLKSAERAYNNRFVEPVAAAFKNYEQALGSILGGEVRVDGDFSVTLEAGGRLRSAEHLSSGQRAVISLCYRLALCDSLFGGDAPFILLDDPFAELDEYHMARAAMLISSLAERRQIIYMYCHASRAADAGRRA